MFCCSNDSDLSDQTQKISLHVEVLFDRAIRSRWTTTIDFQMLGMCHDHVISRIVFPMPTLTLKA